MGAVGGRESCLGQFGVSLQWRETSVCVGRVQAGAGVGVPAGAGPCMEQAPRLGGCPLLVMAVGRSPPWPGLWAPSQVSFHRQWFCESIICSSWGADA